MDTEEGLIIIPSVSAVYSVLLNCSKCHQILKSETMSISQPIKPDVDVCAKTMKSRRTSPLFAFFLLPYTPRMKIYCSILIGIMAILFSGCGGGGGSGGDFQEPANVDIEATPKDIYIGGRTLVRTFIDNVHTDGVVIKFRFPKGLNYVKESSRLYIAGGDVDVGPTNSGTKDTSNYLVYVFSKDVFGDFSGELDFQLEAGEGIGSAKIEVQPAFRNPALPDSQQFSIKDPKFGTDIYVQIFVFPAQ